jgi:hypothetical protein
MAAQLLEGLPPVAHPQPPPRLPSVSTLQLWSSTQSALPANPTRHTEQAGQCVTWHWSATQAPVSGRHTEPSGQEPTQRSLSQLPVSGLHTVPLRHCTDAHGEEMQVPLLQTWPDGQVTPRHEALHVPPWQSWPAPQVTPAHASAWQAPGVPTQAWPSGQPSV